MFVVWVGMSQGSKVNPYACMDMVRDNLLGGNGWCDCVESSLFGSGQVVDGQ